jgi:hypothetical protein
MYDDGAGDTVSFLHLAILIFCTFMTGMAGSAGLAAAMNTTAKSFPDSAVCFSSASMSHADAMSCAARNHNRTRSIWIWPIRILLCHYRQYRFPRRYLCLAPRPCPRDNCTHAS